MAYYFAERSTGATAPEKKVRAEVKGDYVCYGKLV